jgi:hypothetical protein
LRNKVLIPRVDYVVFQLARVDAKKYRSGESYRAEEVETVYLAALPSEFDYGINSRDAITQTTDKIHTHPFPIGPERCTIRGTFGYRPREMAGTYMDGWTRLKQFEEDVFKKSKIQEVKDNAQYFYVLNYYDFIWQRFGAINMGSYKVRGNARENTQVPQYSCDFIFTGDLISVNSKDPLLESLSAIFGEDGVLSDLTSLVNEGFEILEPYLSLADLAREAMKTSLKLSSQADQYISGYSSGSGLYSSVAKLF